MDSTDLAKLQSRARLAYELGRVRLALLGMAPLLILIAAAVWLGEQPMAALGFGIATLVLGAGMLWYGRDPQRAVLPGIVAGMVPLAFALCANNLYACSADGCSSLCMPACTLGGVVAGVAVAGVGNQRRAGPGFWISACGLALLTGAMGCTCIGYSGVVGLGVGIAAGVVPGLLRQTFR